MAYLASMKALALMRGEGIVPITHPDNYRWPDVGRAVELVDRPKVRGFLDRITDSLLKFGRACYSSKDLEDIIKP